MKKNTLRETLFILIPVFSLIIVSSCMTGVFLKTEPVSQLDMSGKYSLILYGTDLTRMAILDREDDDYRFEMTESRHSYDIEEGIAADIAVKRAIGFVYSQRIRWRKIVDANGTLTGYELTPLYNVIHYGSTDILDVDYTVSGKTIRVLIDLKWNVKDKIEHDDFGGN